MLRHRRQEWIAGFGCISLALVGLTAMAAPAQASSLLYDSGLFTQGPGPMQCGTNGTDGCVPASATASFSLNGSNQLVLVLTNTTLNPWQDSQNIGAISFQLNNFGSPTGSITGTLASITGEEIQSTPLNSNINTAGNISSSPQNLGANFWSATAPGGTAVHHGPAFTAIFAVGPHSIVGAPTTVNGVQEYTGPQTCAMALGPNNGCGSSKEFGDNPTDDPMIFETATFVFNLSGTPAGVLADSGHCSAGDLCLSNVQFGFGPDGPDNDDVTAGTLTTVPIPAALPLFAAGLAGLGLLGRRRKRKTPAVA